MPNCIPHLATHPDAVLASPRPSFCFTYGYRLALLVSVSIPYHCIVHLLTTQTLLRRLDVAYYPYLSADGS